MQKRTSRSRFSLWALPLVFACLSCSSTPKSLSKADQLQDLVESHFESMLVLFPLNATAIGDHRFDAELPNFYSTEHRDQVRKLLEDSLKKVKSLGCTELSAQDALTCISFMSELENAVKLEQVDLGPLMPFNQFDSFFADFAELASGSSYVTFEKTQDYENFLSRMKRVPAIFDSMIANMRMGMKSHITPPRILVEKGLKQLQDLIQGPLESTPFYKPVNQLKDAELKKEYIATLKNELIPAYQKLETFIQNEYLSACRKSSGLLSIPGGRPYYQALVRQHTTIDADPNQIMQLGMKEVARIKSEFQAAQARLGFTGTLKQFFQHLRTSSKLLPFRSSDEVLNAYRAIQKTVDERVPNLFEKTPKAPFEIREVEKFKAENASEAYQNPSADGKRPGIFWVPVPHPEKYNSKVMESLFLHEAIPGHHFQISLQQELKDLPRFRRFEGNNAYVEGWALYTEGLGKELGLYQDPHAWIGRLENDMHRAIRLVVDVGIHWKGWTRERAIQFSLDHEPADEASVIAEIERYMAIPGQALSYKMGEQKILELRQFAQSSMGVSFNLRGFHQEILKDGPLPLSVLDTKIKDWVQSSLKQPKK